jgi:adenosylmethionine-8-amino-7-oxononanoate aminotransferase
MSRIFHRTLNRRFPIAVSGKGVWLQDSSGKRYLDASGGAAVSCLGHGHPEIAAAMHEQIDRLAYAHTGFFTTQVAETLAETLIEGAPEGIGQVYFLSGGSEAIEAALKMARQYFLEIGQPQRTRFIARRQSYHGNTLGALAVSGNALRRAPFAPLLMEVEHVSPTYEYRDRPLEESPQAYGERLVGELSRTIERLGPGNVIGFVAETVGGATAGALVPPPGYLKSVRELCDRHGILLILDEVMCGMGRTGSLHACEQEGVAPDLMTIAKGLGAGYQPVGAVLASSRVVEAFARGSGFFQHGHTYLGHPVACAAALAVQGVIRRDRLVERVRVQGAALRSKLDERFAGHPYVGDIRGRGLLLALELVADRSSRRVFDPALRLHAAVKQSALDAGLMVYPMGGTIDGRNGDHIVLAPPFIISDDEMQWLVQRLHLAIDAAIAAVT